ncbi:hypothetical protein DSL72_001833 [Monilinia vaccinii-corymbosi]|uniref:BZIP domain-containing protein n=1 Tax=Monilinia vaccinii-corymbosi TaxID=61207 RepID=A0A8A3PAX9_9HELO|nr:hypothetical protein DSL72_001833 [Monilinia vaccinii-corymbosi]
MTNTELNSLHPGQFNFGEFPTDDALKTIQSTCNHPSSYLYLSPRVENDQAFETYLTDDILPRMFDEIIQTPNIMTHDRQHGEVDNHPVIPTKESNSRDDVEGFTMRDNSINSMAKRERDNSLPSFQVDTGPSDLQPHDSSTVSSRNTPFALENASHVTSMRMNNLPERVIHRSTNFKPLKIDNHTSTSNITPKKKRRPRAKKVLSPTESLLAREKYLEKNRRAARKCRMKKKAEVAFDQAKCHFYAREVRAMKCQLGACQRELLSLIEMCKGVVEGGCADMRIRRFVGNLELREEEEGNAERGLSGTVDLGMECWRLVERCRGARLGEGICGVGEVGDRGGVNVNGNGNGMLGNHGTREQFRIQDDTSPLSYTSLGFTETDEGISSYESCPSPLLIYQLPPQPQPQLQSQHPQITN